MIKYFLIIDCFQNTLEKIAKQLTIVNSLKLKDVIKMDCYLSREQAILGGSKAGDIITSRGARGHFYVNTNGR